MQLTSIEDVFADQLGDLRNAEQQLTHALPKLAEAASDPKLRKAFEHHLEQTRSHTERLEQIIGQAGFDVPDEKCEGMAGLIKESQTVLKAGGDGAARDAALIAAAQRVEHYEIAAYGTARTLAQQLGEDEAARLLQQTLEEESRTDEKLTELATVGGVNARAGSSR